MSHSTQDAETAEAVIVFLAHHRDRRTLLSYGHAIQRLEKRGHCGQSNIRDGLDDLQQVSFICDSIFADSILDYSPATVGKVPQQFAGGTFS